MPSPSGNLLGCVQHEVRAAGELEIPAARGGEAGRRFESCHGMSKSGESDDLSTTTGPRNKHVLTAR